MAPNGIKFSTSTKFSVNANGCKSIKIPFRIPVLKKDITINLGSGLCTLAVKGLTGLVNGVSFLQPLIFRLLGSVIASQVQNIDLLSGAKIEMDVPLDTMLGGLGIPGASNASPLGVSIAPGSAVGVVRGGLSLSFDSDFEGVPPHTCVPKRPAPKIVPGPAPSLVGSYHIAASLSRASMMRAFWGVYHTGALCMQIGSEDMSSLAGGFKLNAGIFALLAPDIGKVAASDAPVMIAIQPTQPPGVTFGTGKKINGKTDSTIKLAIPDFGVSFYVMVHDRYVRIFKLLVDINLGITMIATPTNSLEVAVDLDTLEILRPRSTQAYLVKTTDVNGLIKVIVSLLTQTIGNNKISFPLDISKQLSAAIGCTYRSKN